MVPGLRVVGADRVDRAVGHRLPERVDIAPRPERRDDEERLGVGPLVDALVEEQMVGADLRPHTLTASPAEPIGKRPSLPIPKQCLIAASERAELKDKDAVAVLLERIPAGVARKRVTPGCSTGP